MRFIGTARTLVFLLAFSPLAAGCGSSPQASPPEDVAGFRNVKPGTPLVEVVDEVTSAGLGLSVRDATALGRYIPPEMTRKYEVCFTEDKPDLGAIDLFVVPSAEVCPAKRGAAAPRPPVPDVTGRTTGEAASLMAETGFRPDRMTARDEEKPSRPLDAKAARNWRVCSQSPAAGTPFTADGKVLMLIAVTCGTSEKIQPE
ncbi:PASTA domain-containing protein [Streptomyces sp. NBC_00234]|uniref:PASTA domain-containing protein n=1 Tax=Streptomyces sp. NBC_00234 TaxID=2903638 RepID=UPI002E2A8FFA|nr:PASTA domain-containing protein [Streptomyces sp. NBC_00234]